MAKKNTKKTSAGKEKAIPKPTKQARQQAKALQERYGHLSECGSLYAATLSNPFTGPLGCVPSEYPIMTLKSRTWIRGEFQAGTNGYASIFADPINMAMSDQDAVNASTNTFALTAISATNAVPAGSVLGYRSNSTYVAAQFGGNDANSIQMRVVGCGLRIRYTGSDLNNQGSVYAIHDPTHSSILNATTGVISGELLSNRFKISKDWQTVLYSPVFAADYQMTNVAAQASATSPTTNRWYMGFLIAGAQNGAPFDFECYSVFEAQGRNVRGMTKSHSDPLGLSAVVNVSQEVRPTSQPIEEHSQSFFGKVVHELGHAFSTASNVYSEGRALIQAGSDAYDLYQGRSPKFFNESLKMLAYMPK
jgi:hypothetical protein